MNGHICVMPKPSVKEDVLVAALKVLHQRGFNATGVQDITAAAGVPKGSFYNHFDSKETLCIEVLERYWQRRLPRLEALADSRVPPLDRLRSYFRELNELARKLDYRPGCMVGNFAIELSDQSPRVRDRLAVIFEKWSAAIERSVEMAQADGSLRRDLNAKAIAGFLLNAWEGAVLRAKVDRSNTSLTFFEEIAFEGLLAKAP